TTKTTITIETVNASKFRLLFQGVGSSNGGQFMIFDVKLYQTSSAPVTLTWSKVVTDLSTKFLEPLMSSLLPEIEDLSNLSLTKLNNVEYKITGAFAHLDHAQRVSDYIQTLQALNYTLNEKLSASRNKNVYSNKLSDDVAYAIYIETNETTLELRIWKYDPVIEVGELQVLSPRQSINEWEIMKFNQSGLPSKGSYDVLVIPVEIKGVSF